MSMEFVNPYEIRESVLIDYISPFMDFVPPPPEPEPEPGS
jgi:hypothetical protein